MIEGIETQYRDSLSLNDIQQIYVGRIYDKLNQNKYATKRWFHKRKKSEHFISIETINGKTFHFEFQSDIIKSNFTYTIVIAMYNTGIIDVSQKFLHQTKDKNIIEKLKNPKQEFVIEFIKKQVT